MMISIPTQKTYLFLKTLIIKIKKLIKKTRILRLRKQTYIKQKREQNKIQIHQIKNLKETLMTF
jgi:hypothetical protein